MAMNHSSRRGDLEVHLGSGGQIVRLFQAGRRTGEGDLD